MRMASPDLVRQPDRSLQAASASSVLARSIFSDVWAFPGRPLSSNTESDLDINVVRALMQPEGCGPSAFSHSPAIQPAGPRPDFTLAPPLRLAHAVSYLMRTLLRGILSAALALFLPCRLPAADSTLAGSGKATTNRYEFRAEHSRDGIGKFYMGREIAHVMGHLAADWLERPERDAEEHTETMVELLRVEPGTVVADIGAGTGYFARRLARKVGSGGKVLAVDIQPEMLTLLEKNMAAAGVTNVQTVLGTITDPKLPPRSVDLVLMVDVYHEFDHPYEMMQAIVTSLRPGGRVAFVEFRGEDPKVPIKELHKMTEAQVKKEMADLPLTWVETIRTLPRQNIIVFRKR